MSPGKARLWTGMSCVGTLVIAAAFMLGKDIPSVMMPHVRTSLMVEFFAIFSFFAAAAFVMLPFDFVGGILIPTTFETRPPTLAAWLTRWCRSVAIQLVFYSVTFFFYLQIGREVGAPWLIALFAVLQLALLAGQELIWQAMTSNRSDQHGGKTAFVRHSDQRFVGGITGLPGFESILIPDDWKTRFKPSDLTMLIQRRQAAVKSGGRVRGIVAAMFWNIASFTLAVLCSGAIMNSVADLMTVFLWFLLFSFIGLLILPSLNRRSVFALDRRLLKEFSSVDLQRAIVELDQLTEQDPQRTASAESVFQPIPCPQRRASALTGPGSTTVSAWNVARTALFLSWAFGGPLARAVHCNVGRPELWAMLPTD